ncbi:MAG: zf-HC2 domain-containing protein [Blastocatellia bacterium]|nr:zf-HC2 domain-containing protein [Blastocatellia bacterium]
MNCEQCKNELEDFLYGELRPGRAAEMRAHLADCAVCAALRDEIARENEIFSRFYEQTAIEPAAEMWNAIRARINSEAEGRAQTDESASGPDFRPREFGWLERLRALASRGLLTPASLRQAAFAALLVVLSVAATLIYVKTYMKPVENGANKVAYQGDNGSPSPAPRPSATPSPSVGAFARPNNAASTPKGERAPVNRDVPPRRPIDRDLAERELVNLQIARAEREYQKAIKLLDQAIARQRDRLDPALIEQYEASLALIDDSINAGRRALRERPDDPTAGQFLLAAYVKKLDLMQDIAMK